MTVPASTFPTSAADGPQNSNAVAVPSNYEICDRSGFRVPAGTLIQEWTGLWVRRQDWESRHPQDFVRGRIERPNPSVRPEQADRFIEDEEESTSNIIDVGVGELSPTYPFGYEMNGFILGEPPLYGSTIPYPASIDGSTLYAAWSHRSLGGFEMWWSLHLPTTCTTLRIHHSTGYLDLDFTTPSDQTDQPEGQSYIYWAGVQPWTDADVGQTRRMEFL